MPENQFTTMPMIQRTRWKAIVDGQLQPERDDKPQEEGTSVPEDTDWCRRYWSTYHGEEKPVTLNPATNRRTKKKT